MNLISVATPTAPDVNFQMLSPELILTTAGVVVLLVDAFTRRRGRRWVTGSLALAGIAAGAWATLWLWGAQGPAGGAPLCGDIVGDTSPLPVSAVVPSRAS